MKHTILLSFFATIMTMSAFAMGPLDDYIYANIPNRNGGGSSWYLEFADGARVDGRSTCVTTSGETAKPQPVETFSDGQTESGYCWCRVSAYTLPGQSQVVASSDWVIYGSSSVNGDKCPSNCARYCQIGADEFIDNFRKLMFDSVPGCGVGYTATDFSLADIYNALPSKDYSWGRLNAGGAFYQNNSDETTPSNSKSYYGLSDVPNTWGVVFWDGNGIINGEARCNNTSGSANSAGAPYRSDSGEHCWCRITGYTTNDGHKYVNQRETKWVYRRNYETMSGSTCAGSCATTCAFGFTIANYVNSIFDTSTTQFCEANTINLKWLDDGSEISNVSSDAQTCKYDGSITLPIQPTRTGYNFNGWQLTNCTRSVLNPGTNGNYYGYIKFNNSHSTDNTANGGKIKDYTFFDLTEKGEWGTHFNSYGSVVGTSVCASQDGGTMGATISGTPETSGEAKHCWCKMTGYRPNNAEAFCSVRSSFWTYYGVFDSNCNTNCTSYCGNQARFYEDLRIGLFSK